MGAGRSFVLSAVLAAYAAPAAASSALSQAQAVGPYAALSQGPGIELRDANNRPISRAALARELRAGAAAEAEPVASRAARLLAEFLDRLCAPVSAVRGGAAGAEQHAAAAAGAPRPPKARFVRVVTSAPRRAAAWASAAADPDARSPLGRAFNLPLRI
jgi:hypothetical protein